MIDTKILKKTFEDFNKKKNTLSKCKQNEFRIATYNIHYFTDLYETISTYKNILKDIKKIDATVLGLQELIVGGIVKINDWSNNGKGLEVNITNFFEQMQKLKYKKIIICNTVPSWFNSIYGNGLLVKNHICQDNICSKIDENIYTFKKSDKTCIVSGETEGSAETRCFIKINVVYNKYTFYIYITHLDVASESERLKQIKQIIQNASIHNKRNDVVFILGDFNTFDKNEMNNREKNKDEVATNWKNNNFMKNNGKVVDFIKKSNYFDCHSKNSAKMTTWNNTRIDFIFCNKKINGDFRAEYYYTNSSDHIPVILTITPNTTFTKHIIKAASSKKKNNICNLVANKKKIKKSKKNNLIITMQN